MVSEGVGRKVEIIENSENLGFGTACKPIFHSERLKQPLSEMKPSMIFTCSMGDFFDFEVKESWRENVYKIMDKT